VPYAALVEELIELVREEAVQLGCLAEVERARGILSRGTSAQRQLQVYRAALESGADKPAALRAVVDWLIAETVNFQIPA
ncbi:MAG: carboxylate-amine ligase, partial [Ferrovibrio sp.]